MQYRTCNGKLLKYDQACVTVHNFQSNIIRLYNVSFECFECLPQLFRKLLPSTSESYVFSTTFPTVFQIQGRDLKFNSTFNFEEHVHYGVNVSKNVDFYVIEPPEEWRIETFSLFFLLALIFLSVLWSCFKDAIVKCLNSCRAPARAVPTPAYNEVSRSQDSSPLISPTSHVPELVLRNDSVDVFRGITIALMLFVNYGGGKFWFFEHSAWNGLTVADLVFPWFAWIMGVSVVLSVSSKLRQSVPRSSIFKKVLFRSLVLVALGISLNSYNDNNLHTLRIPGVLQRLGVAYFIVATLETTFLRPQSNFNPTGRLRYVDDLMNSWKQWTFMIFIVAFHSYLTFFVHYPNCPKGYIGPGGLHEKGTGTNCTGGAAGYIDRLVFGADHLYKHSTANKIYHITEHFDPEGLLGTLTTSFTVFLGANAGRILLYYNTIRGPPVRWMILSSIYGTFGVLLSNMFQEDGVIPINKNLWSLSFVFTTSCLAYFTLSVLYMVIDYFSVWKGNMFIQAGRNSILLYIGSEITRKAIPWNFSPISTYDHSSILLMNLWSTTLWLLIAVFLDDSKFYLKI